MKSDLTSSERSLFSLNIRIFGTRPGARESKYRKLFEFHLEFNNFLITSALNENSCPAE